MTLERARQWLGEAQMDLMDYRFRVAAGFPIHGMHHDLIVKRAALLALQTVRELEAAEPLAVECVWCQPPHVTTPGRLPATSGLCDKALAKEMAVLDARQGAA